MPKLTVATNIMLRNPAKICSDRSVGEAMTALRQLQDNASVANALVVVDAHGKYEGPLTARLLFQSMLSLWRPSAALRRDPAQLQQELLAVIQERADLRIHDTLIRGLPTATEQERIPALMELSCDQQLEYIAVVKDGQVLGLVPVTAILKAAASLALTPEHEGIHLDEKPSDKKPPGKA